MTDAEIKKALECCADEMGCAKGCPFFDKKKSKCKVASPYGAFEKLLLDLINRQQADNERLKKLLEEADVNYNKCAKRFYKEGVKEFAERLKATCYTYSDICGYKSTVIDINEIDNLVKEMVGDAE